MCLHERKKEEHTTVIYFYIQPFNQKVGKAISIISRSESRRASTHVKSTRAFTSSKRQREKNIKANGDKHHSKEDVTSFEENEFDVNDSIDHTHRHMIGDGFICAMIAVI